MDPRSLRNVGPYEVKRYVDEGAFAWVFEVVDPRLASRRLALKMLKPDAAQGAEFHRFEAEARLLAGIDHPNIVTIFDFGRDEATGCFFYTMTFVDGPTLKQRLREGPLPVEEAVKLFGELLDGLAYLHDNDIVHRDIKPGNVLLGRDGRTRLSDLGIARVQTERSQTRTGMAVGTALYMSPEQARGRPVDARSDLFSVGLTLYETLTGHVVYDHVEAVDSTSGMDVLIYIGGLDQRADAEFEVVFPREPPLPRSLKAIIARACALRASDRYQDARSMHADLLRALEAPPEPRVAGLSWRWAAGAGGAALLLIGALLYQFLVRGPAERARLEGERASAAFERTNALEARAVEVLDRSRVLDPAPEAIVLEAVEGKLGRAEDYLFDGAEDLDGAKFVPAIANFDRAAQAYREACALLQEGFLSDRVASEVARIQTAALALEQAGAPEVAAERFAAHREQVAEVAAAGEDAAACEAATDALDRIAAAAVAAESGAALSAEIDAAWPRIAEARHQQALTARAVATADPVPDREYRLALREGKRLLLRGDLLAGEGRHPEARDTYAESERFFEKAQAIVPAARARAETAALAAKLLEGGAELGRAVRLLSSADDAFAAEQWNDALQRYQEALGELKGMRARQELAEAAREVREAALAARDGAAGDGAEQSRPAAFAAAAAILAEGERALEAGDWQGAEEAFGRAREAFGTAREEAIPLIRDAAQMRSELAVELAGLLDAPEGAPADCATLASPAGRRACEDAVAAIARGEEALAGKDGPEAQRRFGIAIDAVGAAREAEVRWERTRPRPPVIRARSPEARSLELTHDVTHSFSVRAEDPNGDPLRYRWLLDGEPLAETGPRLDHRVERAGVIEVRVDDGRGGEATERWTLALENRPPALSVQPAGETLQVGVGEPLRFLASVADPDGDAVDTRFLVEGEVRARRELAAAGALPFEFRAGERGTYELEAVATDADGAEVRRSRRLTVLANRAREPARSLAAAPLPSAREPTTPSGLPSLPGWRGQVLQTLADYQRALEERNMADLERVFALADGSPVRAFYERKFERGDSVQVSLKLIDDIEGDGRRATVDFNQTETRDERSRTYQYRAVLSRRPDGRWMIERRERRR